MKGLAGAQVAALWLGCLTLLLTTAGALAATGYLFQPAGTAGCISETGAGPCADGHGLGGASEVAVSPDGKNVYVASTLSWGVARLNRNTTSGAISQFAGTAGCINENGAGSCADGHGLKNPAAVAVSPDGKSVYVASWGSQADTGAVSRFNRNMTTGAITQPAGTAGCISEAGAGPCADGHALHAPRGVAVSPDGKSVYVASGSAVVRLNRDTTTGAISQPNGTAGCISDSGEGPCANGRVLDGAWGVAVSPDGKSVYVASDDPLGSASDAVVHLNRNTATGAIAQPAGSAGCVSDTGAESCADGHGLDGARSVAVSPDGKSVYVASEISDAVARLNRSLTSGAIAQPAGTAGCISETGAGPCANGHALDGAYSVAVSADNKSAYVASFYPSHAVVRLNRDTTSGAIAQPAGSAGCVSDTGTDGTCADGHGLLGTIGVAVSADGKNVYVGSSTTPGGGVARFNRAP